MMARYTPAPWVIDDEGDICSASLGAGGDESTWVAMGCREETGIDFKSEADRALILAAPDMCDALLAVEASMKGKNEGFIYRWVRDAMKKARDEA